MTTRLAETTAENLRTRHPRDLSFDDRVLLQREMDRARSEEARLTGEAKAKDERIKALETILAVTHLHLADGLASGAVKRQVRELLAKVSP